jgi:hypothetical protein
MQKLKKQTLMRNQDRADKSQRDADAKQKLMQTLVQNYRKRPKLKLMLTHKAKWKQKLKTMKTDN